MSCVIVQRRLVLAHLFASKGKISSAVEVYEKIASEWTDREVSETDDTAEASAKLYYNLSQAIIQTTRVLVYQLSETDKALLLEKSVQFLQTAIKRFPGLTEFHLNLSGLYIKLGRPAQAVSIIRDALQSYSSPYLKELLVNLNVAYRQLNQRLLAIQDTWSYLSICSQESPPSTQLAASFLSKVTSYEESLQRNYCDVLTIVCVKYGHKYGPEYVLRLFRMIEKTWTISLSSNACWRAFHFVCLTDDAVGLQEVEQGGGQVLPIAIPHIEHISITGGWWSKVSVFNTSEYVSAASSSIVYVDLDTVIADYSLRNLQQVFASLPITTSHSAQCYMYYLDAACLLTEGRYRGVNSSLVLFPAQLFDFIFSFFADWGVELLRGVHKFDHFLEMILGDMLYDPCLPPLSPTPLSPSPLHLAFSLQDCAALRPHLMDLQQYDEVQSRTEAQGGNSEHSTSGVVCFPLHPKPHSLSRNHPLYAAWAPDASLI